MTYQEAVLYLNNFVNYEKREGYDYKNSFRLDRMKSLCSLLDDPQKYAKSIHVAGSKGKGSTSAMIHSILTSAGLKTGLYTSPHLDSFRERIMIDGKLISENDVAGIVDTLRQASEKMGDNKPSLFELYTAMAFLYFKKEKVDFAVYEVSF